MPGASAGGASSGVTTDTTSASSARGARAALIRVWNASERGSSASLWKIAITVESLRFLGPDTALEEGRTTITPAKAGEAPEITRFTVVYIKTNG